MNYRVTFLKVEKKMNEDTGKEEKTGKEDYLGCVVVDDAGVSKNFTIVAKAFRVAPTNCLHADKTITERI